MDAVTARPDFDEVFRAEYAGVVRVARGLGVPASDAEDVAQSVFLIAHRRFHTYEPYRPVRAWLFGITRRVVKDHRRASGRLAARERARVVEPQQPELPDEAAARSEAVELVEQILGGMREQWRVPFVLAELEGYTAPEIAEATGWKLPTVYTRLRRARAHFEKQRDAHARGKETR